MKSTRGIQPVRALRAESRHRGSAQPPWWMTSQIVCLQHIRHRPHVGCSYTMAPPLISLSCSISTEISSPILPPTPNPLAGLRKLELAWTCLASVAFFSEPQTFMRVTSLLVKEIYLWCSYRTTWLGFFCRDFYPAFIIWYHFAPRYIMSNAWTDSTILRPPTI